MRIVLVLLLAMEALYAQAQSMSEFEKVGKGICKVTDGVLTTKDAYAAWGVRDQRNYELRFRARTPEGGEQVQIWAGFRAYDRNNRYILALRGGRQNNLYLSRLGYMGTDEFLALRDLDFHPVPGAWYTLRVQVCGSRIRVFLNDERLPRIDITDRNSQLAPSGRVTLGGGWISTEYQGLEIRPLREDLFAGETVKEYVFPGVDKERRRRAARSAYRPVVVPELRGARTTVSLDGEWLFKPVYEFSDDGAAPSPNGKDNDWHCMHVPDFWNPIRIWLHGETFGSHAKGASDAYFRKETQRCEAYTFDYKKTAAAWYRQWVELPREAQGKDLELVFDAISKVGEVWINGVKADSHTGMFGEFRVDGSKLFKPGKNLVAVKVVRDFVKDIKDAGKVVDVAVSVEVTNKMLKDLPHGFYNGDPAGIWQPVSLVITDPLKITDVFIKPGLTGAEMEVSVRNTGDRERSFSLGTRIADSAGGVIYEGVDVGTSILRAGEEKVFHYAVKGLHPLLWTPRCPYLYDFRFNVRDGASVIDEMTIRSGFRTFEAKGGYLLLNGQRYWLRGGNQTPFALAPNDRKLAGKFYDVMKEGNIEVTRTHTTPYNELWIDEADRKGVGISFEGTWSWLFLASSMPDSSLIRIWTDEFLSLLKKYRNHPSILFWTVNNEMKFYDNDPDLQRAKVKMTIISDVVRRMRAIDPTRPMCFDSNYKRKGKDKRFGAAFMSGIDDGDMDDIHMYPNWYDYTLFRFYDGAFEQENRTEGRPLISQEMSTGYPNAETGHATRFYTQVHQTAQALVGNWAYEYSDPAVFLESHAFITSELAEALRRTGDHTSGILHFSLATWFRNVYDADGLQPYPVYDAMKRALQPVLVSAELWGRHFYTGRRLPVRVCVVNDREDGAALPASELGWSLVDKGGRTLAFGKVAVPGVTHGGRQWVEPEIMAPEATGENGSEVPVGGRVEAKLVLTLRGGETVLSANEYKVLLASPAWCRVTGGGRVVLVDRGNIRPVFDLLHIGYIQAASVKEALEQPADVYVFNGLDSLDPAEVQGIRMLMAKGGKVLLLDHEGVMSPVLFPEYIKGKIVATEGDISNMDIPESPVFDELAPLDLRYFNNDKREIPTVCRVALRVRQDDHVALLAKHVRIHGYLNGDMAERVRKMETIQGETVVEVHDQGQGRVLLSTLSLEKGVTDPVAGKLLVNMIGSLMH
ncbi:MAG: hypothetical protein J0H74_10210 [Chitinophagaceae bacterium]|nr:hypothetical protein [Chitinophagaceae bacterium]